MVTRGEIWLVNLDPTVGSEIRKTRGLILLDQVCAADKTRLTKKLGVVAAKTLTATLRTLRRVFAD